MARPIEYSRDVVMHIRKLSARDRMVILDGVDKHLSHQPQLETRNRKPMRPNNLAPWELRLGELRVYYEVVDSRVVVHAVGIKKGNTVRIGGEVIDL